MLYFFHETKYHNPKHMALYDALAPEKGGEGPFSAPNESIS